MIRRFSFVLFGMLIAINAHATVIGDRVDISIGSNTLQDVEVMDGNFASLVLPDQRTATIGYLSSTDTFTFSLSPSITASGSMLDVRIEGIGWGNQGPGRIVNANLDGSRLVADAMVSFDPALCDGDPNCIVQIDVAREQALSSINSLLSALVLSLSLIHI